MNSETLLFSVDASTALTGEVDVEALIATIPLGYTARGLLIAPLIPELGGDFAKLEPKLCAPPPSGKYLALASYPVRDHLRLIDAAACRVYPGRSNRQAHRLRGRSEPEAFAQTLLGKAMLSIIEDPTTMLVRFPELFGTFVKGPRGKGAPDGPGAVKIELTGYFGSVEYLVGICEGIVMSFGFTPYTEVHGTSPDRLLFLLDWH
jgi:uncharacterized protein (TIGR02265 family)